MQLLRIILLLAPVFLIGGCATVGYYAQAIGGQLDILSRTRPIAELLDDVPGPDGESLHLEPAVKARLATILQVRDFATQELALPDNNSYRVYAHLERAHVAWNVIATPEFSFTPQQWCFPIAGCVPYRGYFSQMRAQRFAETLRHRGLDVRVAGVAAYSTLGWFADPIFSTLVRRNDADIAALIFHELAHQRVYRAGDAVFNESFATVVEEEGLRRWLRHQGDALALQRWAQERERQQEFVHLLHKHRGILQALYVVALPDALLRAAKRRAFEALRHEYTALRQRWGGYAGYDAWFAQDLNNAHLAAIGIYHQHVPAFQVLLAQVQADLPAFYRSVHALSRLSDSARTQRLAELNSQALGAKP